ncbi:MAG: WecB/TagA/CpsF family glycosyltransferase [Verrucomicrobiota bacterium JB023]|nr:WecB/TagA/CpsF family glycosyltransferase [Verrucomicrobiota bacterium JB023]
MITSTREPQLPALAQGRSNVLGVGITPLNLDLACQALAEGADCPGFTGFVTVTGVHGVVESLRDEDLQRIHNRSFLSTPDGMPMVWVGRLNGFKHMDRVYGPDLMLDVFKMSEATGHRHFFFGGAEGVASLLREKLAERYPKASVVDVYTPPFRPLTEEEEEALVERLDEHRPHFFWVGLSTPKQEKFMSAFLEKYADRFADWEHGLVMLGVGAAFDFHSGRVVQAPRWIQRSGFEWLFRVCMDPKRLWKRYAVSNTVFLSRLLPAMMGLKKYPLKS